MSPEKREKLKIMIEAIKEAIVREEESALFYLNKSKAEHFEELNSLFKSLANLELEHKKDLERLLIEYESQLNSHEKE
ncbi:MAG: hypothetical protein D6734_10490 [Candidatus Schekmanbacteria bacterium]|nr:MAG: hypothetical protein D6734_10490 [Candidatus Schekmanbacteria bacterium]